MIRRPLTWLTVAFAGAALLGGCGGGSGSTTTSTTATPAARSSAVPAPSSTPSTTSSTPPTSSGAIGAGTQQAVAACESVLARAATLPASVRLKIEGVCKKAARGDLAGARAAAKAVCADVINAYPIPSGPAKQQALAACSKIK
jgi:hypothetical protein